MILILNLEKMKNINSYFGAFVSQLDLNLIKNELAIKEKEINNFYDNKDNFHPVISDSFF